MPFGFLLMGKDFLSLFLSSLVTVMYSLKSYEGPALHLFKEFRDVGFRGGRIKSEKNMLVLFEAIRGLGKNSYCIYIKGTDYQTVTPDSLSVFFCCFSLSVILLPSLIV